MRCALYFTISLPTDTAVLLTEGEEGLLRGENCTGKLNIHRDVVAVVKNLTDCESDSVNFSTE